MLEEVISLRRPAHGADLLNSYDFILTATDSYPLAARLWANDGAFAQPIAVALINAGAGIAMGYYDRFAGFLAASEGRLHDSEYARRLAYQWVGGGRVR